MRAMSAGTPRFARTSLLLVVALVGFVALATGPVSNPAPVVAGTAANMEGKLLGWINDARAERGLPKLKSADKLRNMAGDRASEMARTGRMEHTSCLSCALNNRDVSWDTCGEVIAYTTYPWGHQAAKSIFNGWKGSHDHWALLMGRGFHRIGIGVAYRSSGHMTFGAAVLVG
ncbi:MAG TPA: CAP domain-containing protein [Gaiellaceae bacterium]|nr:CAP domain-containing protein [Gaiellaceae bacterium]